MGETDTGVPGLEGAAVQAVAVEGAVGGATGPAPPPHEEGVVRPGGDGHHLPRPPNTKPGPELQPILM